MEINLVTPSGLLVETNFEKSKPKGPTQVRNQNNLCTVTTLVFMIIVISVLLW
jgi:hypothetical protein